MAEKRKIMIGSGVIASSIIVLVAFFLINKNLNFQEYEFLESKHIDRYLEINTIQDNEFTPSLIDRKEARSYFPSHSFKEDSDQYPVFKVHDSNRKEEFNEGNILPKNTPLNLGPTIDEEYSKPYKLDFNTVDKVVQDYFNVYPEGTQVTREVLVRTSINLDIEKLTISPTPPKFEWREKTMGIYIGQINGNILPMNTDYTVSYNSDEYKGTFSTPKPSMSYYPRDLRECSLEFKLVFYFNQRMKDVKLKSNHFKINKIDDLKYELETIAQLELNSSYSVIIKGKSAETLDEEPFEFTETLNIQTQKEFKLDYAASNSKNQIFLTFNNRLNHNINNISITNDNKEYFKGHNIKNKELTIDCNNFQEGIYKIAIPELEDVYGNKIKLYKRMQITLRKQFQLPFYNIYTIKPSEEDHLKDEKVVITHSNIEFENNYNYTYKIKDKFIPKDEFFKHRLGYQKTFTLTESERLFDENTLNDFLSGSPEPNYLVEVQYLNSRNKKTFLKTLFKKNKLFALRVSNRCLFWDISKEKNVTCITKDSSFLNKFDLDQNGLILSPELEKGDYLVCNELNYFDYFTIYPIHTDEYKSFTLANSNIFVYNKEGNQELKVKVWLFKNKILESNYSFSWKMKTNFKTIKESQKDHQGNSIIRIDDFNQNDPGRYTIEIKCKNDKKTHYHTFEIVDEKPPVNEINITSSDVTFDNCVIQCSATANTGETIDNGEIEWNSYYREEKYTPPGFEFYSFGSDQYHFPWNPTCECIMPFWNNYHEIEKLTTYLSNGKGSVTIDWDDRDTESDTNYQNPIKLVVENTKLFVNNTDTIAPRKEFHLFPRKYFIGLKKYNNKVYCVVVDKDGKQVPGINVTIRYLPDRIRNYSNFEKESKIACYEESFISDGAPHICQYDIGTDHTVVAEETPVEGRDIQCYKTELSYTNPYEIKFDFNSETLDLYFKVNVSVKVNKFKLVVAIKYGEHYEYHHYNDGDIDKNDWTTVKWNTKKKFNSNLELYPFLLAHNEIISLGQENYQINKNSDPIRIEINSPKEFPLGKIITVGRNINCDVRINCKEKAVVGIVDKSITIMEEEYNLKRKTNPFVEPYYGPMIFADTFSPNDKMEDGAAESAEDVSKENKLKIESRNYILHFDDLNDSVSIVLPERYANYQVFVMAIDENNFGYREHTFFARSKLMIKPNFPLSLGKYDMAYLPVKLTTTDLEKKEETATLRIERNDGYNISDDNIIIGTPYYLESNMNALDSTIADYKFSSNYNSIQEQCTDSYKVKTFESTDLVYFSGKIDSDSYGEKIAMNLPVGIPVNINLEVTKFNFKHVIEARDRIMNCRSENTVYLSFKAYFDKIYLENLENLRTKDGFYYPWKQARYTSAYCTLQVYEAFLQHSCDDKVSNEVLKQIYYQDDCLAGKAFYLYYKRNEEFLDEKYPSDIKTVADAWKLLAFAEAQIAQVKNILGGILSNAIQGVQGIKQTSDDFWVRQTNLLINVLVFKACSCYDQFDEPIEKQIDNLEEEIHLRMKYDYYLDISEIIAIFSTFDTSMHKPIDTNVFYKLNVDSLVNLPNNPIINFQSDSVERDLQINVGNAKDHFFNVTLSVNQEIFTPARSNGFSLERIVFSENGKIIPNNIECASGEEIQIKLEIKVYYDSYNVLLTEHLPSGFKWIKDEPINVYWMYYTPFEKNYYHDRVEMNCRVLRSGTYTVYLRARANLVGRYYVSPPRVEEIDRPGNYGTGQTGIFVVKPF